MILSACALNTTLTITTTALSTMAQAPWPKLLVVVAVSVPVTCLCRIRTDVSAKKVGDFSQKDSVNALLVGKYGDKLTESLCPSQGQHALPQRAELLHLEAQSPE